MPQTKTDNGYKMDGLKALLEEWAKFQQNERPKLGYPHKAIGLSGAGKIQFDEHCSQIDIFRYEAVNTCVYECLSPVESCAIEKRYLHVAWRFPRHNYAEMLLQACEKLIDLLERRNVLL